MYHPYMLGGDVETCRCAQITGAGLDLLYARRSSDKIQPIRQLSRFGF